MPKKKDEEGSAPERLKEWADAIGYAAARLGPGALSLGLVGVGGLEAFAPMVLGFLEIPHDIAVGLFWGGLAYLIPGLMKGARSREQQDD
ncbi:MAG TPA: hypothetical protein VIT45_08460 [Allosphingosinicella sp.]